MKKYKIIGFICALLLFLGLTGCSEEYERTYKPTAVFHLEGGIFAESTRDVKFEYDLEEDETTYIYDPSLPAIGQSESRLSMSGHHVEGWYKTRTETNGTVTYTDKWDFKNDKMGYEGIELYANWAPNTVFTYELYYMNGSEKVTLGTYTVNSGDRLMDYLNYTVRSGYTLLGMYDSEGNLWDTTYRHPGGDTDLAVGVECRYVEGDFLVVRTASDLASARTRNIYLMNDIDMEGESLDLRNYSRIIEGNGHKIYNFEIAYDATRSAINSAGGALNLSLFGNMEGATIRNVSFEYFLDDNLSRNSFIQTVNFYALASDIKTSTFTNVSVTANFTATFAETVEVNALTTNHYATIDATSTESANSVTYNITCNEY